MRTIEWEEAWSVRRLVYGRRYIPHLLHVLGIWALWLLVIGMLVVDPSLSIREGASRVGVLVLGGTLYRLWVETLSRKIRLSDEGFYIGHIGKFDYPLSRISDLQFSEVDDDWSRAEFYATKKSGRRKQYLIGIPRTAVAKVKALFGSEFFLLSGRGKQTAVNEADVPLPVDLWLDHDLFRSDEGRRDHVHERCKNTIGRCSIRDVWTSPRTVDARQG